VKWPQILHKVGAERASAAVIALDTPGANYRTVWALSKYYPHVKTFVRAHDVDHGMSLEKAGATAVRLALMGFTMFRIYLLSFQT
jgi:voltage-gated potassium channel Kch